MISSAKHQQQVFEQGQSPLYEPMELTTNPKRQQCAICRTDAPLLQPVPWQVGITFDIVVIACKAHCWLRLLITLLSQRYNTFIIPSTPRKDRQKRENLWLSPSLTSPCLITKVCGAFNNNDFPLNYCGQIEELKEAANQWLHKLNENSHKYSSDAQENTNI